jgi:hypothetical protein
MGFRFVHDQSYTSEIFNVATELYIKERRRSPDSPWPLISPICPVVNKLIAHRFPSLLRNIPPLLVPREIVAREARRRLSVKWGCREEEIQVLHVTSCPAKMMSIREPVVQESSYLNGAVGICDIYDGLRKSLPELEEDKVLHHSGGIGLGWCMSGGETAGLDVDCLAVSGLQETIRYLEKIEMGLLSNIDYIELRVCNEGCIGGPLTVADKYQAKRRAQRFVRMFGVEKRVKLGYVRELYQKGWFFTGRKQGPPAGKISHQAILDRLERQKKVDAVLKLLPRIECGVCGAPDCTTLAEDVVDGNASIKDCIYRQISKERSTSGVTVQKKLEIRK